MVERRQYCILIGGGSCYWLAFDDPSYTIAQANMRITVCMKSTSEASFREEWAFFSATIEVNQVLFVTTGPVSKVHRGHS